GQGSEFSFVLTYDIADEKEYTSVQKEEQVIPQVFKGKKILIVEDNPLNQKLASTLLSGEGFVIEVAENGQKAVDLLSAKTYDAILMDIQMPIMDGYQATKKIRRELALTTPIIAMTANAMAGEQEKCISIGMDDYITKPFKSESLLSLLFKHMNKGSDAILTGANPLTDEKKVNRITDLAYLREFSGGKEDFVKEMIEVFLEQNPIDVKTLEDAISTDNYAQIKAITHTLQTSLGFVGFPAASLQELKLVENMAGEQKNLDLIKEKLKDIISKCRLAQAELKEEIK
ncbi:MAG TPA: response regulator, partial [Bacteroidia bacterium]